MKALNDLKRRRQRSTEMGSIIPKIMPGVWGMKMRPPSDAFVNEALYSHYESVLNDRGLNDGEDIDLADAEDVKSLIDVLQPQQNTSIQDLELLVNAKAWQWLKNSNSETFEHVIEIAFQLWLFCKPEIKDVSRSLRQVVHDALAHVGDSPASDLDRLRSDFSAITLAKPRIIKIVYTSYLEEHLTFVGKTNLLVFRHVSVLIEYQRSSAGSIYPPGFLKETINTIRLLYPGGRKSEKRRRNISKRAGADLEAQIARLDPGRDGHDLDNYQIWRHRLAHVQNVFETSRPKTLKQRWFDRREEDRWAALWIAVILATTLTVIFSIISAVTGIMQTYKAFR